MHIIENRSTVIFNKGTENEMTIWLLSTGEGFVVRAVKANKKLDTRSLVGDELLIKVVDNK